MFIDQVNINPWDRICGYFKKRAFVYYSAFEIWITRFKVIIKAFKKIIFSETNFDFSAWFYVIYKRKGFSNFYFLCLIFKYLFLKMQNNWKCARHFFKTFEFLQTSNHLDWSRYSSLTSILFPFYLLQSTICFL